ncbi:hypothetical protein QOZ80_2AG0110770 [Eleusine coracana subsp. coracana]|nr:hypothetical protein QOZ80_2AG0110770 [Eleusine coracana subsp. coracana]
MQPRSAMFHAGGGDDNIGRYLAHIPLPEPHLPMTTIADDLDLLATQFVDDPQHAPDDLALQASLMTPNAAAPATTTGFVHEPAAMDVVGGYQEAAPLAISVEDYQYQVPTTMAIQPPEMVVPSAAEQAYAFLEHPLGPAATGMDGALPPSFQGTFHGGPAGNPSLYDGNDDLAALFDGIDVGDATGTGYATTMEVEPDDVHPVVEDDSTMFVPFVPGQLDCTNCHTVRELLHESANHKLYLILHGGADHGTFHHLITYRTNIGADGQTTTNEHMYLDLYQHRDSWVQSFIAKCVEALGNDNSGQLIDSWSTLGAAACSINNNSTFPVVNNDAHAALELDMLKKILSTSLTNDEAPPPNGPLQEITPQELENSQEGQTLNTPDWHELNLPILDSSNLSVVQDGGPSSPAECLSLLGEQRKRISSMTMADTLNLLHMSREDAAKHLRISSSSLKRLWNKNGTHRWPGRRINSLNKKIKKLEDAARKNGGTIGMLGIKEELDKVLHERAQLYASTINCIRENEMKKGAGPSRNK